MDYPSFLGGAMNEQDTGGFESKRSRLFTRPYPSSEDDWAKTRCHLEPHAGPTLALRFFQRQLALVSTPLNARDARAEGQAV